MSIREYAHNLHETLRHKFSEAADALEKDMIRLHDMEDHEVEELVHAMEILHEVSAGCKLPELG